MLRYDCGGKISDCFYLQRFFDYLDTKDTTSVTGGDADSATEGHSQDKKDIEGGNVNKEDNMSDDKQNEGAKDDKNDVNDVKKESGQDASKDENNKEETKTDDDKDGGKKNDEKKSGDKKSENRLVYFKNF